MYDSFVVGNNIRRIRLGKDMTINELAMKLNLSPSHVTQVELGTRNLSVKMLFALTEELEVDFNEILGVRPKESPIDGLLNSLSYKKAKELKEIFLEMINLAIILERGE